MTAALGERLATGVAVVVVVALVAQVVTFGWPALRARRAAKRSTRRVAPAVPARPQEASPASKGAVRTTTATPGPQDERRRLGERVAGRARSIPTPRVPRPSRRAGFVAAVVVGAGLRLLWVIWATRTPNELRDPAEYLRIAIGLTEGISPRFGGGGGPSAYWPPGYPALLAPFVWVARETGWASAAFVASLVNVVAGTITIVLSGFLAARWIGPHARNTAAWLVALCPALVYWTSTAHSETAFTPFLLGILALATVGARDGWRRRWLLVGLLAGAAFLVRSPGLIGLAAPALAIRAQTGTWRGSARATGLVALAVVVVLVPWTIRNGVQVGVWSPASTNNAGAACFGNHDDALPLWEPDKLSPRIQADCYGGSPFDDRRFLPMLERLGAAPPPGVELTEPDEAHWYRSAMGKAVHWATTHPVQATRLYSDKLWETWSSEGRVVDGARNYSEPGWAGRWHGPLGDLANLWGWIVGALALIGLALVPACRRALPIWVPIVLYTLAILVGVIDPHYRYPVVPLVAVLAAGLLTRDRHRDRDGGARPVPSHLGDNEPDEPRPATVEMST